MPGRKLLSRGLDTNQTQDAYSNECEQKTWESKTRKATALSRGRKGTATKLK